MTAAPILEVSGLSYAYGSKVALDAVGFTAAPGRFTALLGPNGAGKSTLYALITQLLQCDDGAIRICGSDLKGKRRAALSRLGVVFQQPTLDLDLSVEQNLRYFAALRGLTARQAEPRIADGLARLDMADRRRETVRQLNGGHRRRVEIVRALLHEPQLLLLDEPTVGLDVPTRRAIVEHIHDLCREKGVAALWATHLIDEVRDDDAVVVLHQGTVRANGDGLSVIKQTETKTLAEAFEALTP